MKPLDHSKITRICQAEYRNLVAELIGLASWITRICQIELIGFAEWNGHFFSGPAAAFQGFHQNENKGQRNYQQITAFKHGTNSL